MVFYSRQSTIDLHDIMLGLTLWKKHPLSPEHAISYVRDIRAVGDKLDTRIYHANARYLTHKRYGDKVYPYKRNKTTTWYLVYTLDEHKNVYIQKITSNHTTIADNNIR